ncbi:hypothetical protein IM774_07845 [Erysipelotrichaceae bacterium RD49]|nr:hypothetical protein [Erysipelotrichaceae bacterium RD49]
MPKLTLFSSRDTEPQLVRAAKKDRPIWMKVAMGVLIFLLICTTVYLFCPYTKIQALVCSGNYYFTPQQIYGIANVSVNNRTYLHLPGQMAEKLEANPLIESANVSYDGQVVNIAIKEKMIIGYYEENGENYLLTSQGERIPVTNTSELRTLVHYPLLVDLTPEVMNEIAKEVREHPEELTRSVFEKVAEILPWQESYDKNMLKLVLQDGNTVFTSIPSLFMMSTYQQVLTNLHGESVCLMLDGDNGVVNNIGCSYIHLSPEERAENRQIPKSVLDPNVYPVPQASEENSQASSQSDQAAANPDPAAQPNQDSTQTPPSENQDPAAQTSQSTSTSTPSGEIPADLSTIADWEASAVDYLQYSPSTNLFYNKENGIYYVYDTASDTFYPY